MHVPTAVALTSALIAFALRPSTARARAQDANPIPLTLTFIAESRTLTSSEVQALREATIKAMAGRYLIEEAPTKSITDGPPPDPGSDATEEYQLDAAAMVRFSRLTFPSRGVAA